MDETEKLVGAILRNDEDEFIRLIDSGVNVNRRCTTRKHLDLTPFSTICRGLKLTKSTIRIMKVMLKLCDDIDEISRLSGYSRLYIICSETPIVTYAIKMLLCAGANPHLAGTPCTPLSMYTGTLYSECGLKSLIEAGATLLADLSFRSRMPSYPIANSIKTLIEADF